MVRKVEQICDGGASIYFLFFTENNFTWISESVTWMMAWLYLAGSVSGSRHTVMADWREQSNLWHHLPVLMWTSSCSLFAFCCAVEEPEWKKSYIYTWSWDCNLPQTDTCIVLVFHMRFVWLRFDIYLDSWYLHNVDLNAQFTFFCLFRHLLGWLDGNFTFKSKVLKDLEVRKTHWQIYIYYIVQFI